VADTWTVLVYMGWGGDPASPTFEAIQEQVLVSIAATEMTVDVVYQFARSTGTERGRIYNGQREILATGPAIDVTDPDHLTEFLDWAQAAYPSTHTALFLKDHGIGSTDLRAPSEPVAAHFVADDSPADVGTPTVVTARSGALPARPRRVVRDVVTGSGVLRNDGRFMPMPAFMRGIEASQLGRVDVLGLDACQLGSIEVAYELREVAAYWIASESSELTVGWSYPEILRFLSRGPATPRELATMVVSASKSQSFNLIGLELAHVDAIARALDAIASEIIKNADVAVAWLSTFSNPYTDGVELAELVASLEGQAWCAADKRSALVEALARARVGEAPHAAAWIGIYLPGGSGSFGIASYGAAAFAQDTAWAEMIGRLNYALLNR